MKKYLLTALLWVFAFVGFTNASNYTFTSEDKTEYSPSSVTFDNSFTLSSSSVVSFVANEQGYNVLIICPSSDTNQNLCCILSSSDDWETFSDNSLCTFEWWVEYFLIWSDWDNFSSITISDWQNSSGGSDSSSNTPLLSGWTTVFSWIISSLWSVMSEFIPYVAFVGLWLLGAIIGFVAIKRLVNRIRAKILWTFSGWRRRK